MESQTITQQINTLFKEGLNIDSIKLKLESKGLFKSKHYIRNIVYRLKTTQKYQTETEQKEQNTTETTETETKPTESILIQQNTTETKTKPTESILIQQNTTETARTQQKEQNSTETETTETKNHLITINRIKNINDLIPKQNLTYYSRKIGDILDIKLLEKSYKLNQKNYNNPETSPINIMIEGETATAKTRFIKQFCYINKIPYHSLNLNGQSSTSDLIGGFINGGVFMYGYLSLFVKMGGIIVLEELNTAQPEILVFLNELLNDRQLTITETSEILKPHQNFMLIATQNPPHYEGRKILQDDLLRRFMKIEFNYDLKIEQNLIKDKNLIPFIEKLRFMRDKGEINKPIPISIFEEYERNKKEFSDKTALTLLCNCFNEGIERDSIKNTYELMFNKSTETEQNSTAETTETATEIKGDI